MKGSRQPLEDGWGYKYVLHWALHCALECVTCRGRLILRRNRRLYKRAVARLKKERFGSGGKVQIQAEKEQGGRGTAGWLECAAFPNEGERLDVGESSDDSKSSYWSTSSEEEDNNNSHKLKDEEIRAQEDSVKINEEEEDEKQEDDGQEEDYQRKQHDRERLYEQDVRIYGRDVRGVSSPSQGFLWPTDENEGATKDATQDDTNRKDKKRSCHHMNTQAVSDGDTEWERHYSHRGLLQHPLPPFPDDTDYYWDTGSSSVPTDLLERCWHRAVHAAESVFRVKMTPSKNTKNQVEDNGDRNKKNDTAAQKYNHEKTAKFYCDALGIPWRKKRKPAKSSSSRKKIRIESNSPSHPSIKIESPSPSHSSISGEDDFEEEGQDDGNSSEDDYNKIYRCPSCHRRDFVNAKEFYAHFFHSAQRDNDNNDNDKDDSDVEDRDLQAPPESAPESVHEAYKEHCERLGRERRIREMRSCRLLGVPMSAATATATATANEASTKQPNQVEDEPNGTRRTTASTPTTRTDVGCCWNLIYQIQARLISKILHREVELLMDGILHVVLAKAKQCRQRLVAAAAEAVPTDDAHDDGNADGNEDMTASTSRRKRKNRHKHESVPSFEHEERRVLNWLDVLESLKEAAPSPNQAHAQQQQEEKQEEEGQHGPEKKDSREPFMQLFHQETMKILTARLLDRYGLERDNHTKSKNVFEQQIL